LIEASQETAIGMPEVGVGAYGKCGYTALAQAIEPSFLLWRAGVDGLSVQDENKGRIVVVPTE
jgi:hypothetical protein